MLVPFRSLVDQPGAISLASDPIRANVKYEKAFTFRPTVKMVFAANNLPYSRDRSSGFLQGMIVLPFNRKFLGSKADKGLTEALLPEFPGVRNMALTGLARLRSHGYVFTESAAVEAALDEFKANLSLVFAFVGECFTVNPEGRASHRSVSDAYTKWCRTNGHENSGGIPHKKFWESFRTACREERIEIGHDKSNGADQVVGVTLKPERSWSDSEVRQPSKEME
ncbi:hypothetical protein AN477_22665 [Alicyclobacillus ferrooxydans]|uniref:DNA primase/nucleoside triphosphatase C-terminal domain-containing protein n=1 Tax=Alicyclobacillus ferrooxydans TaxID=471514 RepID=A0A0P9EL61_9BACL|nr:hypothetical protein AN477_22665 [Alicyclobacillus ferrooxydans]